MRALAVALCISLVGLSAEAAMLHVHRGNVDNDHHHESPAAHSHKLFVELAPADSALSASAEDSSAIPVVLAKATASQIYYLLAVSENAVGIGGPSSSHVPRFVITARSHGPPAGRSCSLRAPPRSHLL